MNQLAKALLNASDPQLQAMVAAVKPPTAMEVCLAKCVADRRFAERNGWRFRHVSLKAATRRA